MAVLMDAAPYFISIHAPHAGRDRNGRHLGRGRRISIHAPHAGRDFVPLYDEEDGAIFQSTRPMRGATLSPVRQPPEYW